MKKKEVNTTLHVITATLDGDMGDTSQMGTPDTALVLATRNMVLFPGVIVPIMLGRKTSLNMLKQLKRGKNDAQGKLCAIFSQRKAETEEPDYDDLYHTGVYARLLRVLDMQMDGNVTAIFQASSRCHLDQLTRTEPYLEGNLTPLEDDQPEEDDLEFSTIMEQLLEATMRLIDVHENLGREMKDAIMAVKQRTERLHFICTNLPFAVHDKMELLQENSVKQRAMKLLKVVNREISLYLLRRKIQKQTQEDLNEQQREYFLHQQIKNIQAELGADEYAPEVAELRKKAATMHWSDEVKATFEKEVAKLEMYNTQSPDYATQYTYLQQMLSLPWGVFTRDSMDLKRAERQLNRDHYGMERVKERILEHLAVLRLRGDLKAPILCLYGPPGVGKTSLGKSIAKAMKRKYVRISLGGLHDESEIRGHRRTYIGAMPGRIIKSLQRAGSSNPVFVLDEIDKVTQNTVQGDPSSALLEVLDPEQNTAFHDNYLDVDYDLSHILFIATANDLNPIPRPLLDRMEVIEVSGYIAEEKREIARQHLVPRQMEANGLDKLERKPRLSKSAIDLLIEDYTRESGVRQLEKQIGRVMRKLALKVAQDDTNRTAEVKASDVRELLGPAPFFRDVYQGNSYAGVVTGLAWTSVGGEILYIETSLSRGKGGKLTLTGNLGNVMKESAAIALEYVKAHAEELGVDHRVFDEWNIHIHVPEGAVPKDGPSAGITIATSIASALTQRKVRAHTAMTGEITLRGKVMPVGGIKEKILAAKRAGITHIVMCSANKKDVEEIPEKYREGLSFDYVESVDEVWNIALTHELVEHPVQFAVEEKEEKA